MIDVRAKVQLNPNMPKQTVAAIISTMDRISGSASDVAKAAAPANTGLLKSSIQQVRRFRPPEFVGGITTNVPYAIVMEEGRRPGKGFPPFDPTTKTFPALARWVRLKGLRPKKGQTFKGLTFIIARKIARKGIKGRKYFLAARRAIEREFPAELERLGATIQRLWESGG